MRKITTFLFLLKVKKIEDHISVTLYKMIDFNKEEREVKKSE